MEDSSLIIPHSSIPADTQACGRCHADLPISAFGVCAARASGRNPYCKPCINQTATSLRVGQRAWREAQRKRDSQGDLPLIGLTPSPTQTPQSAPLDIRSPESRHEERVMLAIRRGARTQREIFKAIRPVTEHGSRAEAPSVVAEMERIGESLAVLMFDSPRRVQTSIVQGRRGFVPLEAQPAPAKVEPISFSKLGGIVYPTMRSGKGRAA